MYCKYLDKAKYSVSYLCFDMLFPRLTLPDVNVIYVNLEKNKILRYIKFIRELRKLIRTGKFHLIFHVHTKFTIFIRIFAGFNPMVLDIRSGDLNDNSLKRWFKNIEITLASRLYPSVSVISSGLATKLKIQARKIYLLPLGGERCDTSVKNFNSIHLLYLGTLEKRNIQETVLGLAHFMKKNIQLKVTYDILGSGSENAIKILNDTIKESNLQQTILFHGRKSFNEVIPFFERNNIGVVFLPQKEYFEYQPSTKFYECLLAGMPVIATNTFENRVGLQRNCGVIIEDNAESFCDGLEYIYTNRKLFDSTEIKNLYHDFTWENIVKDRLEPYFENLIK